MSTSEPGKPRSLMPLPDRVVDDRPLFHWYLAELLELADGELPPGPGLAAVDEYEWEHAARAAVIAGLPQSPWPEAVFNALIRVIVHDPNPSFNRQLIEPALAVAGHRRVQESLIELLVDGTNAEKAGAARAWYWAKMPFTRQWREEWNALVAAEGFTKAKETLVALQAAQRDVVSRDFAETKDLRLRWREAALREFVSNEDLDVRRCILPGLYLDPDDYPDDLKDLAATAVHIARTHPDEYIRHRVEHQV